MAHCARNSMIRIFMDISLVLANILLNLEWLDGAQTYRWSMVNSTIEDTFFNLSLPCPGQEDSFPRMSINYTEAFGVSVEKTYQLESQPFEVTQGYASCQVSLLVEGLRPARKYDVCLRIWGSSGSLYGPSCESLRTAKAKQQGASLSFNLEGVALIVLTALGLMFALMACIFYEHVIARSVLGWKLSLGICCHQAKTKAWHNVSHASNTSSSKLLSPPSLKSQLSHPGPGSKMTDVNHDHSSESSPRNYGVTEGIGPLSYSMDQNGIGYALDNRPNRFKSQVSKEALEDDLIKEVLNARPSLMKGMKPHKKREADFVTYDNPGFRAERQREAGISHSHLDHSQTLSSWPWPSADQVVPHEDLTAPSRQYPMDQGQQRRRPHPRSGPQDHGSLEHNSRNVLFKPRVEAPFNRLRTNNTFQSDTYGPFRKPRF